MSEPSTPSEAMAVGVCPTCFGRGRVHAFVPPPEHEKPCPLCEGTGTWPPPGWDDDEEEQ